MRLKNQGLKKALLFLTVVIFSVDCKGQPMNHLTQREYIAAVKSNDQLKYQALKHIKENSDYYKELIFSIALDKEDELRKPAMELLGEEEFFPESLTILKQLSGEPDPELHRIIVNNIAKYSGYSVHAINLFFKLNGKDVLNEDLLDVYYKEEINSFSGYDLSEPDVVKNLRKTFIINYNNPLATKALNDFYQLSDEKFRNFYDMDIYEFFSVFYFSDSTGIVEIDSITVDTHDRAIRVIFDFLSGVDYRDYIFLKELYISNETSSDKIDFLFRKLKSGTTEEITFALRVLGNMGASAQSTVQELIKLDGIADLPRIDFLITLMKIEHSRIDSLLPHINEILIGRIVESDWNHYRDSVICDLSYGDEEYVDEFPNQFYIEYAETRKKILRDLVAIGESTHPLINTVIELIPSACFYEGLRYLKMLNDTLSRSSLDKLIYTMTMRFDYDSNKDSIMKQQLKEYIFDIAKDTTDIHQIVLDSLKSKDRKIKFAYQKLFNEFFPKNLKSSELLIENLFLRHDLDNKDLVFLQNYYSTADSLLFPFLDQLAVVYALDFPARTLVYNLVKDSPELSLKLFKLVSSAWIRIDTERDTISEGRIQFKYLYDSMGDKAFYGFLYNLNKGDFPVVKWSYHKLGELGEQILDAEQKILDILDDSPFHIAREIVGIGIRIGYLSKKILIKCYNHPNRDFRIKCARETFNIRTYIRQDELKFWIAHQLIKFDDPEVRKRGAHLLNDWANGKQSPKKEKEDQ